MVEDPAGQLSVPQTRSPAQSVSRSQSPSQRPQGAAGVQQEPPFRAGSQLLCGRNLVSTMRYRTGMGSPPVWLQEKISSSTSPTTRDRVICSPPLTGENLQTKSVIGTGFYRPFQPDNVGFEFIRGHQLSGGARLGHKPPVIIVCHLKLSLDTVADQISLGDLLLALSL